METGDVPPLVPLLTLTVGDTEVKTDKSPNHNSSEESSLSPNSDPARFNNYLNRGSELWTHWTWLGGQGKMSLMRCNYCLVNKQLKNAPKCRRHLIKCPKTPEIVRKYFEKKEVEASRVSAFMREIRSKEVKFARNDKQLIDDKVPVPTANDLKHIQQKQQQVSINNVIVTQNGTSNGTPKANSKNKGDTKISSSDLISKTNILMNYSPLINRTKKGSNNSNNQSQSDNLFNDIGFLYQLMSLAPNLSPGSDTSESNLVLNKNCQILANRLKRKHSADIVPQMSSNSNGNGNTNKENKDQHTKNGMGNNTVIINLDDVNSIDDNMFFNPIENGHNGSATKNGTSRKKKRDSTTSNGCISHKNGNDIYQTNASNRYFANLDSQDLEIVHDDLNDLLASALISSGVEFSFIVNPYFQKFITQLVNFSSANKNYRLPAPEKLSSINLNNLIRKFDYETAKIFSECDSIIVSFDSNKENISYSNTGHNMLKHNHKRSNNGKDNSGDLDVNLLISSANMCSQVFFKTISSTNTTVFEQNFNSSCVDENIKSLNNQIDSLINKIGSDRINAVILPYNDGKSSELIYSYLSACHNHIVPLTNSYQLFHHLLCDICKIPSIYKLITQCMNFFQELEFNFVDFQEENQNHWKQVFESDNLKIYKHFLNKEICSSSKNTYWISLNLMLCWFLVAKASITELFENGSSDEEKNSSLLELLDKINIEQDQLGDLFSRISVLFNFLTPFINAIHLIENESLVISDIVKIYYDVKLTINNNNFFDGINILCDKTERQAIDIVLNNYLQEQNFSRYFFLAYYLDPRFREDKRLEENEELITQVYDALFCYANALGCVSNEEEDREKLADSLYEFRNGDKLYGMQLLKCPKSPVKFWKHLRRFPGSSKLAYCASRLLSISTRSMLLAAPIDDKCTTSLYHKILTNKENEIDSKDVEKVLPVKSYLLSRCQKIPIFDDEDKKFENDKSDEENGELSSDQLSTEFSISNIISNVITSLNQYSLLIAQPFTSNDLSCLIQTSN